MNGSVGMVLWGKGELRDPVRIEWRWQSCYRGYWGRWAGHHRVFWHAGPLVISWARRD
jgi:hypothetical protein